MIALCALLASSSPILGRPLCSSTRTQGARAASSVRSCRGLARAVRPRLQPFTFTPSGAVLPVRPRSRALDARVLGRSMLPAAANRSSSSCAPTDHLDAATASFRPSTCLRVHAAPAVARHLRVSPRAHPAIHRVVRRSGARRRSRGVLTARPNQNAVLNVNLTGSRNDRNEIFAIGTFPIPSSTELEDVRTRARGRAIPTIARVYRRGSARHCVDVRSLRFSQASVPLSTGGTTMRTTPHAEGHAPTRSTASSSASSAPDAIIDATARSSAFPDPIAPYASARSSGTTPVACANCQVSVYCWNRTAFPSRRSQTCATCASIGLPVAFAVPL